MSKTARRQAIRQVMEFFVPPAEAMDSQVRAIASVGTVVLTEVIGCRLGPQELVDVAATPVAGPEHDPRHRSQSGNSANCRSDHGLPADIGSSPR